MYNIDKPELGGLEYQVECLLKNLRQLKLENETLRKRLADHKREAENLENRNRHAADQIDQVIARLKENIA